MGWYVVTAGPSAGKSSVIRELAARGYKIAPEAARIVVDQGVSEGRDAESVRRSESFQRDVIDTSIRIENQMPTSEDVFFDRALADSIAYCELYDREAPDGIYSVCTDRYDAVFMLERIPFSDDYARTEDETEAEEIHDALTNLYVHELDVPVYNIGLKPVDERADEICRHI